MISSIVLCLRFDTVLEISIYLWFSYFQVRPKFLKKMPKLHLFALCLNITEKVAFNIASEASYLYILSGKKLITNAKNGPFWRVIESLKLVVKQCYQTEIGKNDTNWNTKMRHFWWISNTVSGAKIQITEKKIKKILFFWSKSSFQTPVFVLSSAATAINCLDLSDLFSVLILLECFVVLWDFAQLDFRDIQENLLDWPVANFQ